MKRYSQIQSQIIGKILGCVLALTLTACDAASEESIPQREIEWQHVEAVAKTDAMGILIVLSRDLDRWHKGSIERIKVSYSGVYLHDNLGQRKKVSPQEWKGLVTLVYNTIQRSPENYMSFRTPPNDAYVFDDGEGEVRRFLYHIRMIDTTTLEFQKIRAFD